MSKITAKPKLTFKQTISLLILAAIVLFAASGYYWYKQVLTNPQRILSGMLDKSLQSSSVQRSVSQKGGQSTSEQAVFMSFSPKVVAQSVTKLEEQSMAGKTKVTTETLGTKETDYIRYKSIEVSGGKAPNLSNIEGVWGKRGGNTEKGQPASFLNEALLIAVPFGNLNTSQRAEVKNEISKVKLYDAAKTQTEFKNGRPVITYTTSLDPKSLVQVLSKYVEVTNVGTTAELNPQNYEGAEKIQIRLEVDVLTRHLKSIEFANSGRLETYRGYNLGKQIDLPKQTIGVDELQSRLQALEQPK